MNKDWDRNVVAVRITKCTNSELWYFGKKGQVFKYSHKVMDLRFSHEKADWEEVPLFIVHMGGPVTEAVNRDDCNLILGMG